MIRRFVPCIDIVISGGMALLNIWVVVLGGVGSQDWGVGRVISLIAILLSFFVVAGIIIGRLFSKPDYITKQGVAVWSVGRLPTQELMEHAIEFFIERLPTLCIEWKVENNIRIYPGMLGFVLDGVCCEWRDAPITAFSSRGWRVKDKGGLQHGQNVMVRWTGDMSDTALFHELGHVVRQRLLTLPVDREHKDTDWWKMIEGLDMEFSGLFL